MYTYMWASNRPDKDVVALGVGVTGNYEPPNMGAENKNPGLHKSSPYS